MEKIKGKLSEPAIVNLPLGFQKITTINILPFEIEEKLLIYNCKYNSISNQTLDSKKPISKIIDYGAAT